MLSGLGGVSAQICKNPDLTYFLNLYPKLGLHTKFQLPSTKTVGLSLDGGNFTPKTLITEWDGGWWGEGVNIF